MSECHQQLDQAIREVEKLRRNLRRGETRQVQRTEDRNLIKSVCEAWFRNHRSSIGRVAGAESLEAIDGTYTELLAAADRSTSRKRYNILLQRLREGLLSIRAELARASIIADDTTDAPPRFDSLVGDVSMRDVLTRRWLECGKCVSAGAPLAATVMIGGLLEALLLARFFREGDMDKVFKAAAAPKDPKQGKALPLQEWKLRHYIDVAHELGWISKSAKDLGEVIRDYRNYIHPHKEHRRGLLITEEDARLVWEVFKGIARQLLGAQETVT